MGGCWLCSRWQTRHEHEVASLLPSFLPPISVAHKLNPPSAPPDAGPSIEDGRVFVWDMGTRDCIHMFEDEGTLRSTALAASPDGSFVACASDMGVVNLYNASTVRSEARPKPLRALLNLTTMVDNLKFNHDGQVLVMSSRMKKDALRVVHTASQTVFNNWPTAETPLGYVHSLDISPTSGYLALVRRVGNAAQTSRLTLPLKRPHRPLTNGRTPLAGQCRRQGSALSTQAL